jgi:hypothetical protein
MWLVFRCLARLRPQCKGPGYKTALRSAKLTTMSSAKLTGAGSAKLTT